MTTSFERARCLLLDGLRTVEETTIEDLQWLQVKLLLREIRADPVLGAVVESAGAPVVPRPPGGAQPSGVNTFWVVSENDVPHAADEWGRSAYRTLTYLDEQETRQSEHPISGSVPQQFAWRRQGDVRSAFMQGWLRPMVRWLLSELDTGASLQGAVERWIQRMIWLGPRGVRLDELLHRLDVGGPRRVEDYFQRDLQGYLFDQGIPFADQGREHPAANGRVDFLLRSGDAASVELKVWRESSSSSELGSWFSQARTYPSRFGITSGYLVILSADKRRRVQLGAGFDGHPPALTVTPDLRVQVRLCDLGEAPPSREHGTRRDLVFDASTFRNTG